MNKFEWTPCSKDIIKKLELEKIEILPKHRYIYFKGDKRFKKQCKKNLQLKTYKYPKGNNKRYDAKYTPTIQTKIF